ncbi:putative cell wall-binding protein [Kineosphaera limosa]|uniref:Uncharacterized protein n=1 Tax=Kineosphaera limosa NBRC 100340 TaxID=1184609 RepID=K6XBC6_9MICO|nr:cell wall-binding repeat-containing protein [Kineosphaera limosa]NYE01903.1 putative cell wall-binding protein [Kineosphaera limosa]GAB96129.1 hypothetical protein KILIM_032_00140 [Kineosphaera limosa NBRC 100340]
MSLRFRLAAALAAFALAVVAAPPAQGAAVSTRVFGPDRVATAIAVYEQNRDLFTSDTVVLTRSDQFPDALAAGPLAVSLRAPVLITPPRSVDQRVLDTLRRQRVERVVVVGGTSAVSAAAVAELERARLQVERVSGNDRFTTAEAVARKAAGTASVPVFVADGMTPHDALIAGAIAGRERGVVVLSAGGRLTPSTRAFLQSRTTSTRLGIGKAGSAAVTTLGLTQVVAGGSPEATSVAVANYWYKPATSVVVTSAAGWGDALAGAPLAALRRAPLLLAPPREVSGAMKTYLRGTRADTIVVLGGEAAVPAGVERELVAARR